MLTTALDLLGIALIAAFGWFIWPPLVLAIVGVGVLAASWQLASRKANRL
jgi:hypothetical protein